MLYPNEYYKTFKDVEIDRLKSRGIKGVIIDIDNTLVPWSSKIPDESVYLWINKLKNEGLKVCLISNNTKARVQEFNKNLGCPVVWNARKPLKSAYMKASQYLDCPMEQIAVIGDQIFTDIWGGNRMGMYTILVDPLSEKEFFWTKLIRKIEKRLRNRLVRE